MAKLIRKRYEPLEVAGRGGQGEVLLAIDHQHDRKVALKVRAVRSAEQRAVLLEEARILLSLEPHPALPLVREDFFVGERYYIVMDWVEGKNLQEILDERGDPGLPASTVLRYVGEAAEALDHLHAHEPPIIHQDVKPANMVLSKGRRVVLVDFGIAASSAAEARSGRGTRGYQAPELARGDAPTPAADVYGLAATAFALLTGSPPAGVRPTWEGIPEAAAATLERALRRGLSTDPERRPGSAGELVEILRAWLDSSTGQPPPPVDDEEPATGEQPIRLMLVDDHPVWRQALRAVLEQHRFAEVIAEASDGEEAIEKARVAAPDVVIMDMNLPTMNGVEATRRILADGAPLKILVLSASGAEPDVLEAIKSGASGYLLKSAAADEVADAVRRVKRGEPVFTPSLAGLVLGEFRKLVSKEPDEETVLTPDENDVLKLLSKGHKYNEIADELSVPVRTVHTHARNIHAKLQLRPSRAKRPAARSSGTRAKSRKAGK
jgi:DNA-binding NarL/FixJ family response regulator/predicted Ser/Thr protein kinase